MGIVYKLKPEVIARIIEEKKKNQLIGCRKLAKIIYNQFRIKVSKSSINALTKDAGLSMPIGRRPKNPAPPFTPAANLSAPVTSEPPVKVEQPIILPPPTPEAIVPIAPPPAEVIVEEAAHAGLIFLKAADYLLGGTSSIAEIVKHKVSTQTEDVAGKSEYLIYEPLAQKSSLEVEKFLQLFAAQKFNISGLEFYIQELQFKGLNLDIGRSLTRLFREIRCVRIALSNGNILYLDGQLRSTWPTPYIPYGFSNTLHNLKKYINQCFLQENPMVFYIAPDDDAPPEDFFNFIFALGSNAAQISTLTFCTEQLEEAEVMAVPKNIQYKFIFGLGPKQFGGCAQLRILGNFKPLPLGPLGQELYFASGEVTLSQVHLNKSTALMACVLRKSIDGSNNFILITNLTFDKASPEEIAELYLNHWPQYEDTFGDFRRKIGLFAYTAENYRALSLDDFVPGGKSAQDIRDIRMLFGLYLRSLDAYVKRYFMPWGYEENDFPEMVKWFYSLPGKVTLQKDYVAIKIATPANYPRKEDLRYLTRRINEMNILLKDGRKIWVSN